MKPLLFLLLSLCVVRQLSGQRSQADSLQDAKEAIGNSDFDRAEALLNGMLRAEHGLTPEVDAEVSLYLAYVRTTARDDTSGGVRAEVRALRSDPAIDLGAYVLDFGKEFVELLRRQRKALIVSGGVPVGVVDLTSLPTGARLVVDHAAPDLQTCVWWPDATSCT